MLKKRLRKHTTNNTMTSIKKLKLLIFIIFLILSIYLFIYFIPKNYNFSYNIDGFKIKEEYDKKSKLYIFTVSKNKYEFKTISTHKYTPKRKLINSIDEFDGDNSKCIIINSEFIDNNRLCISNNEMLDSRLLDLIPKKYYKTKKDNIKKHQNITINLDDKTYLIWNYNSFLKINESTKKQIKLFNEDIYNLKIMTKIDDYLVLADYDQKYNFNKLIRLNLKTDKIDEIELKNDVSFDSRILGTYKNNIYILDEKNKKEYEINIKKKKVNIVNKNGLGIIYNNNNLEKVNLNKIINNNISFTMEQNYNYILENGNLYLKMRNTNTKIKVSNLEVKYITYANNDEVYYISEDKLYKYDFIYGEVEIINDFEFNFNYENMVVIY